MLKHEKDKWFKAMLCVALVLTTALGFSQEQTVTGKVVASDDGMGIPGVNVVVKGTTNGTATDFDGNYSITASTNATLVFSYLGFVKKEVGIAGQSTVNVSLEEDTNALDEVVVVGYGTQKKSDITGSVSSVSSEEINAFPVLNAEQALQGRAAGVVVQSNNGGEPGAPIGIKVRGNTSIGASSEALVVVDGFVGANYPQPADIESVEVLKDASATAIYGSRGANGVILVTTKKGRKGKMVVEVNSSYSGQSVAERLDLLNADQFATYIGGTNTGAVDTDWQDLIYRAGNIANHQLSFSGGSDDINYYVSGNYFNQKGVVINSGFERFSFLANVDAQISKKLKIGFNSFGSRSNRDGVATQAGTGGRGSGDVISIAYRFRPDLGIRDANGNFTFNTVGDEVDNPFAIATESIDETSVDLYRANFYGDYEIIDGLSFKSTFGFSASNSFRGTFKPSTLPTTAGSQGGIAEIFSRKNSVLLSENYLTYNKEFGKANVTLLAGYSYQKSKTQSADAGAEGFVSNSVSYYSLESGAVPRIPASSLSESEIQSQFGRVNLEYDDRYLATFTARRDGSSNFSKNEKYAFFPSGALGWRISNENFLRNSNAISNLKLRASYGVTGNQAIQPFQSLASFQSIYAVVGDQTVNAIVPNQLSNPDLKWETSYQTNIGLDLGLLDNRLALTLDVYNIDTKDLILGDTSTPEYVGFLESEQLKNVGEINNKGIEITLSTKNVVSDNFSWTTDLNWSKNKNEVVKLINGDDIFFDASPGSFLQDETHLLREGEPVGQFYGYQYEGVYQGGALPAGTATFDADNAAGGELFADLDGSGTITTADRQIIGDPNPDWTAGVTNTFRYKDFDLSVFFQGAFGGDIFSFTFLELASGGSNATTEVLNAWTPSNTDTNVPSAGAARAKRITSRFVYDGSYVRLKNLALGYNLPRKALDIIGLDGLRISVSGQNLLTFTDYPGTDPEAGYASQGNQNSNVNQGFDYGSYPNLRSYTLSVNLKF